MKNEAILEVNDLTVRMHSGATSITILDNISFDVRRGETLALVGESGSGKSTTALALMRLLQCPPAEVTARHVRFDQIDIMVAGETQWRNIVGNRIAMVFQDALTSLNPLMKVGSQIEEAFSIHRKVGRREAGERAVALLQKVGIPDAARRAKSYPHQFSGGMRQRAMIAMAIALQPDLLIADEPTTALDVTVQAQIMDLLKSLSQENGMAVMLITHDMGVVAESADRVAIMYAGRVVEVGCTTEVITNPAHPYTIALLEAMPQRNSRGVDMRTIPGVPPSLKSVPQGCAFHPRCPRSSDICREITPRQVQLVPEHLAACHHAGRVVVSEENDRV